MQNKSGRPEALLDISNTAEEYDFGAPEMFSLTLTPTLTLQVREPTVTDFSKIEDYVKEAKKDTEMLVKVLCLLHVPDEGKQKLTVKNAMKIRGSQLKEISKVLMPMITMREDKEADKSEADEEL